MVIRGGNQWMESAKGYRALLRGCRLLFSVFAYVLLPPQSLLRNVLAMQVYYQSRVGSRWRGAAAALKRSQLVGVVRMRGVGALRPFLV